MRVNVGTAVLAFTRGKSTSVRSLRHADRLAHSRFPAAGLPVHRRLNVLNLALDTAGSVITRRYAVGYPYWQICMVRYGSAAIMTALGLGAIQVWSALAQPGTPSPHWAALAPSQPRKAWLTAAAGVLLATFLSPAFGMQALFLLPLGTWSALTSLGPIWAVPIVYAVRGERTSGRGLAGAALAVTGAASLAVGRVYPLPAPEMAPQPGWLPQI